MKIAVLGAGAGGTAIAFDCAFHGHEVRLFDFPQFFENIAAIGANKCITAEGDISGSANIAYAGHEIDRALSGAELVYVVGALGREGAREAFEDVALVCLDEFELDEAGAVAVDVGQIVRRVRWHQPRPEPRAPP